MIEDDREIRFLNAAVTTLTPGEAERLAELGKLTGGVDVWRDWEGSLTAWPSRKATRDSAGIYCALSIARTGAIAHYTVNQPRYFSNLAMLLDDLRQAA